MTVQCALLTCLLRSAAAVLQQALEGLVERGLFLLVEVQQRRVHTDSTSVINADLLW